MRRAKRIAMTRQSDRFDIGLAIAAMKWTYERDSCDEMQDALQHPLGAEGHANPSQSPNLIDNNTEIVSSTFTSWTSLLKAVFDSRLHNRLSHEPWVVNSRKRRTAPPTRK